jgi:hypothetical protein
MLRKILSPYLRQSASGFCLRNIHTVSTHTPQCFKLHFNFKLPPYPKRFLAFRFPVTVYTVITILHATYLTTKDISTVKSTGLSCSKVLLQNLKLPKASREILRILWDWKCYFSVHNSSLRVPTLCQINSFFALP